MRKEKDYGEETDPSNLIHRFDLCIFFESYNTNSTFLGNYVK